MFYASFVLKALPVLGCVQVSATIQIIYLPYKIHRNSWC